MKRLIVLGIGLAGMAAAPASADENYFAYSYGAEGTPKGATELYLWATDRRDKGQGNYNAQDYRIELEQGVTSRFAMSGYLNFRSVKARGLEPEIEDVKRDFSFQGVNTAFKYNFLSPYRDGLGLTLYVEPGWSRIEKVSGEKATEYELEVKALLQKNFLNDRLVAVANLTLEPEWEKEKEEVAPGVTETEWEKELVAEITTGLGYRVAPNWVAGVEGRYTSVYPDWTKGLNRETYAVSVGPSVHYAGKKWWFTATYLPQLFGSPSPGRSLALDEYEKREIRLKLGYNF